MTYPLREILAGYRATVEKAWSADTAHEGYAGAAGSPVGQCGVTSAWLQRRLLDDHGIDTLFCTGDLECSCGERLSDHCWLEGEYWVADLTSDQLPCANRGWELPYLTSTDYSATRRYTAVEAANLGLQGRLALLTEAVGS